MPEGLTRNTIRCLTCSDVIESTNRHDYRSCSCGKVSVDGGLDYPSRSFPDGEPDDWYEDLSTYGERPNPGPTAWDLAERKYYSEELLRAMFR